MTEFVQELNKLLNSEQAFFIVGGLLTLAGMVVGHWIRKEEE